MSTITSLQTNDNGANSREIINTNFKNLNTDKLETSGGTLSGQLNFSGTTHAGVKLLSLTTSQRDALSPANGMIIYNTTTAQVEFYQNGAWTSTTGASDMDTTTKGVGEQATTAEIDAGTDVGSTSAHLVVTPDQLKASTYYTSLPSTDQKAALAGTAGTPSVTNKYVTNDDVASTATASKVVRRDSNADILVPATPTASTGATSKTYVDALINYTASDNLITSTDAETSSDGDYTKARETKLWRAGTVRIKFSIKINNPDFTSYGRIYLNGVATGTERTNSTMNYVEYSEDITISAGDLVQIYIKSAGGTVRLQNFRIYADSKANSPTVVL